MIPARASLPLRASLSLLAFASLAGCPSESTTPHPPTVDRIVIGGGSAPRDPPAAQKVAGGEEPNTALPSGQDAPPPPSTQQIADGPSEPPAPPLDPGIRDERPGALRPRSRALLVVEIQGIEALFASIAKDNPDRPKVARRLADDYSELSVRAEVDAASGSPSTPNEAAKNLKLKAAARERALKFYTMISNESPKYCDRPDPTNPGAMAGCQDEVLYYMGFESERAGKLDVARRSYFQLIQMYPESKFVPLAYFAFGEVFYEAARSDPTQWPLAAQVYAKVLQFNGARITPYAEARLRLVCQKMNNTGASSPGSCDKFKGRAP